MRLVIIGGDAAGMSAASAARRNDPNAEVIVLEKTQDVSYGACGLPYKLPVAGKMDDLVVVPARAFIEKRGIDLRLGHAVTAISPDDHSVSGEGPDGPFELTYDKLLIATGTRVKLPPIDGLTENLGNGVYTLTTLDEGRQLKQALQSKPKSAIVIGGGYIGLEAAENLREAGLDVRIIEAMPVIQPRLPETLRQRILDEAQAHGVPIHADTLVRAITRSDHGLRVETDNDSFDCDIVLAATGVQANAELASEAGLALGASGSIAVDAQLKTSAPDIFAAGDCTDSTHALSGKSVWVPLALRANRAGKLAGENMLGASHDSPPIMATAVFKFFGLQIGSSGLTADEAKQAGFEPVAAEVTTGTRAHYYPGGGKLSIHLLADRKTRKLIGAALTGPESAAHRLDTLVTAMHAGLTVDALYNLDLAYAPPFGPAWPPPLIAAKALMKALDQAGA